MLAQPPRNIVGRPIDAVIVLTVDPNRPSVIVSNLCAYPQGFALEVEVRTPDMRTDDVWFDALMERPRQTGASYVDTSAWKDLSVESDDSSLASDSFLELLVKYPDGRAFSNHPRATGHASSNSTLIPMISLSRSGADGWRQDARYWIEPLPSEGELEFQCEWKQEGIAARSKFATRPVIEAAGRAVVLWPNR
jgi:hypothetical protein